MRFATAFLMACACHAQEFEVATVKLSAPSVSDLININLGTVQNGVVTFANVTLNECLQFAYGLVSDSQVSGPDWIKSRAVRFDIVAKAPPDTNVEQFPAMMRALLAERLKVALHHEAKSMSFLALEIGKKGPKLKAAGTGGTRLAVSGRISSTEMPMSRLATLLSRFERQIIVDKTGLSGAFEVLLEWTPENRRGPAPGGAGGGLAVEGIAGNSLYSAVQEQLGLKLEARKGPIDSIVVDRAEKIPAEN